MGSMKPLGTKAALSSNASQSTAWAALVPLGLFKSILVGFSSPIHYCNGHRKWVLPILAPDGGGGGGGDDAGAAASKIYSVA